MLEAFRVAKFRFTVCAKEPIRFPVYKGAAFRGGFGYTFKRVVCVIKNKECDACLLKQKCIYSYIFETSPPQDTEILRLYPKVPHPFVIEPPITEKQTFEPGEKISFHLILIGNAIDYAPYFIYTFTELGKQGIGQGRGKYDLIQVEAIDLESKAVEIYHNKTQTLTSQYPIIQANQIDANSRETPGAAKPQPNPPSSPFIPLWRGTGGGKEGAKNTFEGENHNNKITISILTPLRVRFDGHITDNLEFHVLIRNLLRRISSLSYFHCSKILAIDFKGLIERSGAIKQAASNMLWYDWTRYSTRQEEWMSLGGVTGKVSYEGDIVGNIGWLVLGHKKRDNTFFVFLQFLHVTT